MVKNKQDMIEDTAASIGGAFTYADFIDAMRIRYPKFAPTQDEASAWLSRAPYIGKCGKVNAYTMVGNSTKIQLYEYKGKRK